MWRKLIRPHSLIATFILLVVVWALDIVRINLHFLNPFNETIRDYEITDIVYARLRDKSINLDERIVLVNIGEPNRDTLRLMLDRIATAQPKVVSIDILLSGRKNRVTDSLLQISLKRLENTVLAIEVAGYDEEKQLFQYQHGCDTLFCDHTYTGFVNLITHDTSTIRLFSPKETTTDGECLAFSTQTARLYDIEAYDHLSKRRNETEEIYYAGNGDQFVQFEARDILDTTILLEPLLKDKIVLIGFLGTYAWDNPLLDRHYTPLNSRYTGRNTPDMYGMVIHANIIQMILNKTYIREPSWKINLLLTFLFYYLNIHLYYQIFRRVSVSYHFVTRFIQLGEIVLLFFLVALLFHFYRIKLEVGSWITALVLTFDTVRFYDSGIRKRVPFLNRLPFELPPAPKKTKLKGKPPETLPAAAEPEKDQAAKT